MVPQYDASSLASQVEDHIDQSNLFPNCVQPHGCQYEANHMCKLSGHEGSIFRIAWSFDGSKLVSVSDDRRWSSYWNYMILKSPASCAFFFFVDLVSSLVQCSCLGSFLWDETFWEARGTHWPCAVWSQCPSLGLLYFWFCKFYKILWILVVFLFLVYFFLSYPK